MGEKETAYHEAGHCLVGYRKKRQIERVTIIKKGGDLGKTEWENTIPEDEIAVAIKYAGDIAERILKKDCPITLETACTVVKTKTHETCECPPETGRMPFDYPDVNRETREAIYEEVRDTLNAHWDAVEALALELIKRKGLPGSEAEAILKEILAMSDGANREKRK